MKFKPSRPIYLNRENTGLKSEAEVIVAIEQLRSKQWLCTLAAEDVKTFFHLSFDDLTELAAFKKEAASLGIHFKADLILPDSFEDFPIIEAKEDEDETEVVPDLTNDPIEVISDKKEVKKTSKHK